jgi:ERCC4-related helicase
MENIKKSFLKQAALKKEVKLKDHQLRAIDKILNSEDKSLLAAHATGSGKTLTGIAAFEKLKEKGYASKAIVVVPSSLKSNFVDSGVKKFTNSSVSVFGAKNEKSDKKVGDKSNSTYNVISYDLFREHGDKVIEGTGADTLIMDEVHKVRSTEGTTYNKLKELRPKFKQAITLTGSVVNNEPNDIVPLMDITFKPTGHKLISKDFFDRTFVDKKTVTEGFLNPKVYIEKNIKNKQQLAKYLEKQIDYVGHDEVEKFMPKKNIEVVKVPMSKEQSDIYHYTMSSVDPITRWKISNNIPVGQKEAADAFSKLTQARQVSTDPSVLSDVLKKRSILEVSPKVKSIVNDAHEHLQENDNHKLIIYGNLIHGQLDAVERGLKEKGLEYTKFYGVGNEGSSAGKRTENIKDYMSGKKRILLVSGAGAEGLDLKGTTMFQMAEGHYNPERIHQAESRAIRLGSPVESVKIKRYVSLPKKSKFSSLVDGIGKGFGMTSGNSGVDSWVYSIAEKKTALNNQFKDVLQKQASIMNAAHVGKSALTRFARTVGAGAAGAGIGLILRGATVDQSEPYNKRTRMQKILTKAPLVLAPAGLAWGALSKMNKSASQSNIDPMTQMLTNQLKAMGQALGEVPSSIIVEKIIKPNTEKEIERVVKQKLLDQGKENLVGKKHYSNILNESGIGQRALDLSMGLGSLAVAAKLLNLGQADNALTRTLNAPSVMLAKPIVGALGKFGPEKLQKALTVEPVRHMAGGMIAGGITGLAAPFLVEYARRGILNLGIKNGTSSQLEKGIVRYEEKLRKKMESKYKTSKAFINEYDTKKDLGIDLLS